MIFMTIQILPPDEAAKRARERVAEWKRQREIDAAKVGGEEKNQIPAREQTAPSPNLSRVRRQKQNRWAHMRPEIPEHKKRLNFELAQAAGYGTIVKAGELLEAGADIDNREHLGKTPLFWAAREGKKEMVRFLLEKGADVNAKGTKGYTALIATCERKLADDIETVNLLISAGADVNGAYQCDATYAAGRILWKNRRWTALMMASDRGHAAVVEALICAGSDVNYADDHGVTPLMTACYRDGKGAARTIQVLIQAGAAVNAKDNDGKTALAHARCRSQNRKILIQNGATE